MSATLGLEVHADRCDHGFAAVQHPTFCGCQEMSEWVIFTAALRSAAQGREVHQRDVRPLLRGRIEPKHVGLCYRRAIREGLIREVRREQSNDEVGRNTNKYEPVYELRSAA